MQITHTSYKKKEEGGCQLSSWQLPAAKKEKAKRTRPAFAGGL
jgi:hypothetical protein